MPAIARLITGFILLLALNGCASRPVVLPVSPGVSLLVTSKPAKLEGLGEKVFRDRKIWKDAKKQQSNK